SAWPRATMKPGEVRETGAAPPASPARAAAGTASPGCRAGRAAPVSRTSPGFMVARGQAEGAVTVRPGSVWTWCSGSVQGKEEQEQHREAAQGGRADGQHQLTIVVERRPARPQDLLNRPLE